MKRRRTSDVLVELTSHTNTPCTRLLDIIERLGDRTFGILLVIVAVLAFIPIISFFAGPMISLLGLQMVVDAKKAWMPRRILMQKIPNNKLKQAIDLVMPKVTALESYMRPRWVIIERINFDRVLGAILMVLGIIIAMPFPFINFIPALVVIFMGLGLTERDGMVQAFAGALSSLAIYGSYLLIVN